MACRFFGAQKFNQYIGDWTTRNVVNFERMRDAARHTRTRVRREEASHAFENASRRVVARRSGEPRSACRFGGAEKFNQDIGGWNTQNVQTTSSMRDAARHPTESPSREGASGASEDFLDLRRRREGSREPRSAQVLQRQDLQREHQRLEHGEGHDYDVHARRGATPETQSVAREASDASELP